MLSKRSLTVAASCLTLAVAPAYSQTVISFPNFNDCSSLELNGSAVCAGGVLRLTSALNSQTGTAFTAARARLGYGAAFSTSFQVIMSQGTCSDADGPGADGLAFVVQPVAPTALGVGGGSLGYGGIAPSLGVELDTWDNGVGAGDPNGNHVGIDLDGDLASVQAAVVATRLNNGTPWYVWVDYDGLTMEVRVDPTPVRPAIPTVSYPVALEGALGSTEAYVGFTAATGGCAQIHDIVAWQLTASPPLTLVDIPTLSTVGVASLALVLALTGWIALRRRTA